MTNHQTPSKPPFRHPPSLAEDRLWPYLRDRKILGYKFHRQYPVGTYMADFYCVEAKFLIEVDGPIHDLPEQKEHDQIRQKALEAQGIVVFRVRNEEIMEDIMQVVRQLKEEMRRLRG